jgi:hypothetical protein
LGIVSFLCGSVAFLTASLPYLGMVTIPLSAFGLLLGVVGLRTAAARRSGPVFPSAGLAVSLPVLILAICWPSLLGRNSLVTEEALPIRGLVMRPPADSGRSEQVVMGSPDWVDASRSAVQQGDVRVRVTTASMQLPEIKGRPAGKEKYLILNIQIDNRATDRQIDYASWGEAGATLRDNLGKPHRLKSVSSADVVGHVRRASVLPGKSVSDVLIFDLPPPNISYLHLELAGSAVGGGVGFRFEIPWAMIRHK